MVVGGEIWMVVDGEIWWLKFRLGEGLDCGDKLLWLGLEVELFGEIN